MQIKEQSRPTPSESRPVHSTLLALVQALADQDEKTVVATAAELVNTGRVVLMGNFKGHRLEI
jgi:hypothetical protein